MKLAELRGSDRQIELALKLRVDSLESIENAGREAPAFKVACDALATAIATITDCGWIIGSRHRLGLKATKRYGAEELTITSADLGDHQLFRDEKLVQLAQRLGTGEIPKAEAQRIKEMFIAAQRAQLAIKS